MDIQLKEVKTRKELIQFIKFPINLYKGNSYYVPPLIKAEIGTLDKTVNPVFENAESWYFLAYKKNKIVGRIAIIINWKEVKDLNKSKVRFGWFDVIDDEEVTKVLIDKVEEIGRKHGLKIIEGPVGFSNLDKAGLLTMGFDEIPTIATLYNYEYYERHIKNLDFKPWNQWNEYTFSVPKGGILGINKKVVRVAEIARQRYKLKPKFFNNIAELLPHADRIFELLDISYGNLDVYIPFTKAQIEHYKNNYLKLISPRNVVCVVNEEEEIIAFAVTMFSYSKAFQKAKGKLYPFGWYHLLKASKSSKIVDFYLIGTHPKYQGKGIPAIMITELTNIYHNTGIERIETNPELVDNLGVQAMWDYFIDTRNHKQRKSFYRDIEYKNS